MSEETNQVIAAINRQTAELEKLTKKVIRFINIIYLFIIIGVVITILNAMLSLVP